MAPVALLYGSGSGTHVPAVATPATGAVIAAVLSEALRGSEEHAQGAPNDLSLALETIEAAAVPSS